MASFCKQCAEELDFEADFTNMFEEEPDGSTFYPVLCETCGPDCQIIDNEGTCASPYCDGHMETSGPHGQLIDGKLVVNE